MSIVVLGIDPGLKGGLAVLTRDGDVVDVRTMFTVAGEIDAGALADFVRATEGTHRVELAVMERVGARPGQGVCSMFTFGVGYGVVQGILAAFATSLELVRPQTWQKHVIGTRTAPDPKAAALLWVKRRYPGLDLKGSMRSRKPHDGIVDAICLAEYARRLSFGVKEVASCLS